MTVIRTPAVSDAFYPADPAELSSQVEGFLNEWPHDEAPVPKAIVAPHAGYRYSGAVAAAAYARLLPAADTITRVILLGPCHRVAVRGVALSEADYFETPLGRVEVDKAAESLIADMPNVGPFAQTHAQEHALEVHLPFLQKTLRSFKVVPMVVGETQAKDVAKVLDALWGGPETLIVVSSDLSHFLDYAAAQEIDNRTCDAIKKMDPSAIERNGACGRFPLGGLLHTAKARQMTVETLDLRNSGDTAGPKDRVVGYGSWAFFEPARKPRAIPLNIKLRKSAPGAIDPTAADFEATTKQLLQNHGDHLLHLAHTSIQTGLKTGKPSPVDLKKEPKDLQTSGACFVTLKQADGRLRGCIGSPTAHRALAIDVAENAFRAAFRDPRFPPVATDEYATLRLSISVLSPQSPMTITDEADLLRQLRPRVDGLVISDGGRRALFLPSVWAQLPTPAVFLAHLKQKAGMPTDHWSETFCAHRFIAEEIAAPSAPPPLH